MLGWFSTIHEGVSDLSVSSASTFDLTTVPKALVNPLQMWTHTTESINLRGKKLVEVWVLGTKPVDVYINNRFVSTYHVSTERKLPLEGLYGAYVEIKHADHIYYKAQLEDTELPFIGTISIEKTLDASGTLEGCLHAIDFDVIPVAFTIGNLKYDWWILEKDNGIKLNGGWNVYNTAYSGGPGRAVMLKTLVIANSVASLSDPGELVKSEQLIDHLERAKLKYEDLAKTHPNPQRIKELVQKIKVMIRKFND